MKQALFILLICGCTTTVFAQKSNTPFIKGYENKEYLYFDSLDRLWYKEITCFAINHQVYVSFKVDSNARIAGLQIVEMPVYKLPDVMRLYVEKLIYSTNGLWQLPITAGQQLPAKEVLYRFDFKKKDQFMQEHLIADRTLIEYYFEQGYKIDIIKRFDNTGNGKIFTLHY